VAFIEGSLGPSSNGWGKGSKLEIKSKTLWWRIEVNDGKIYQNINDKIQTLERDSFKTHSLRREDSFLKIKKDKLLLFLSPFLLKKVKNLWCIYEMCAEYGI
jgi:hypothetical protein